MQRLEIHSHEHKITSLHVNWGLERRPLWGTLTKLPLNAAIKWVDRFAPFEAIACEWAVVASIEGALKINLSERTQNLRSIYLEIQRVLWSFDHFAGIFRAIHDRIRLEEAMRLREIAFEIQEALTGNRVLPQVLRLGGLEREMSLGESKKLRATIRQLSEAFRSFFGELSEDPLFSKRLSGVLCISQEEALRISLRGPFGQASGVLQDARIKNPIGIYGQYGIHCYEGPFTGDALARFRSVQFQVSQSLKLLALFLASIPEGDIKPIVDFDPQIPEGIWTTEVESGAGPIFAALRNREIRISGHAARLRGSLEQILIGIDSDDLELALSSLGMDFSQADVE